MSLSALFGFQTMCMYYFNKNKHLCKKNRLQNTVQQGTWYGWCQKCSLHSIALHPDTARAQRQSPPLGLSENQDSQKLCEYFSLKKILQGETQLREGWSQCPMLFQHTALPDSTRLSGNSRNTWGAVGTWIFPSSSLCSFQPPLHSIYSALTH